ncbi:unnamed protein product [Rhizophagus irregularis]|nr:unnamed protein product [Rhizophagus irregularis]
MGEGENHHQRQDLKENIKSGIEADKVRRSCIGIDKRSGKQFTIQPKRQLMDVSLSPDAPICLLRCAKYSTSDPQSCTVNVSLLSAMVFPTAQKHVTASVMQISSPVSWSMIKKK